MSKNYGESRSTALVKLVKSLYIHNRFFWLVGLVMWLFLMAYIYPEMYLVTHLMVWGMIFMAGFDLYLLYAGKGSIYVVRQCAERFSNGDNNRVQLIIENHYTFEVSLTVIDEVPYQFQLRDINFLTQIAPGRHKLLEYNLRPVKRGVYEFGFVQVFARTTIGIFQRRFSCDDKKSVKVYPSYLQLRKYELLAITNQLDELGIKKVRKVGHSLEFERIKDYVQGDDIRTINWKATARKNSLMVNQYQDEKAQNVYSVIDKGRLMYMPFEGMSLLDYAINASLVISNVAIKKDDKAGLVTFEKSFDGMVPAGRRRNQMQVISHFLYNQKTAFGESDYANLYVQLKRNVKRRSLLLLYTNFESIHNLDRQLPYFRLLNKAHLLVVIFFKNTELDTLLHSKPSNTSEIYRQVIAEQFEFEKQQIVKVLRRHGIQAILTKPKNLSIDVINKYIELKARQMI